MSKKVEFTFQITSKARSRDDDPYIRHTNFIDYCNANKVDLSENFLEAFEKNGLLYPCVRVLKPRELLRRECRAANRSTYKIRDEWMPFINLEDRINESHFWQFNEFQEAIKFGHPLERAIREKHPFVFEPRVQKFKTWNRYQVIVEKINGNNRKESRANHYYSPWKIFFVNELNKLNTVKYSLVMRSKLNFAISGGRLRTSSLNEFSQLFAIITSFSYRRALLEIKYFEGTSHTQNDWADIVKQADKIAKKLFVAFVYTDWIRFLRKLIELYEKYRDNERLLLSEEAKNNVSRTVRFLIFATGHEFQKICDDVSGPYKKSRGRGWKDGVMIYPESLEKMFPDEKWDLQQNVRHLLNQELKILNSSLIKEEQIPEHLCEQLFDELVEDPKGSALAAVRKVNKAYANPSLWQEDEIWSGIRNFALSIEDHGKCWIGGSKLDNVFTKIFHSDYDALKAKTGEKKFTDVHSTDEFIEKLKSLKTTEVIPINKRCGRHLLIAHLTRNYSVHWRGLFGDDLGKIFI